jgi:hypothetical protein
MNRMLRHIELLRANVPDWAQYPFTIPEVAMLDRLEFHPAATFLVGDNGSCKPANIEAANSRRANAPWPRAEPQAVRVTDALVGAWGVGGAADREAGAPVARPRARQHQRAPQGSSWP